MNAVEVYTLFKLCVILPLVIYGAFTVYRVYRRRY